MNILGIVLAGGQGTRLHPLTAEHAKPAVAFAAGYRIIDFVLASLVNSGVSRIFVLGQYKPQSLVDHIDAAWSPPSTRKASRISVVLPETECAQYGGTADAVHRNMHLIEAHRPDVVAVFAADHIYRMDVRQMVQFHRKHDAEVTIAAVRVPLAQASNFGVVAASPAGELREFREKPEWPMPIPGIPSHSYASMGNYIFKPRTLFELLEKFNHNGRADFGHHILPTLPGRRSAWIYDFSENRIPGIQPHEERGYWRDIGTMDTYRAAQRDVVGPSPRFSLDNPKWPIRSETTHTRARSAALVA